MKRKLFWVGLAVVVIAALVVCILCVPKDEQPTVYAIKVAESVTNGQITVSVSSATAGTKVTLEVTPDDGYLLKEGSLKANETTVEDNSFVMPDEDVTITAEFEKIQYSVSIGDMEHGEVTASRRTAGKGDKVVVTVIPKAGYQLKEGTLKANDIEIVGGTFEMPGEAVVITAEFEVAVYSITVENDEGGTITLDKEAASYGELVTVIPHPDKNREYVGVLVNGTEIKGLTFEMPAANATVIGIFQFSGDVLGDLATGGLTNTRSEGFDISNDFGSNAYAFTTAGDQQWVFFKDITGTDLLVRATISAKEIYNNDEYPRFGVVLYNGTNTVYFNVEATGLANNESSMVVTGQLGTSNWEWGSMLQTGSNTGDYSGDDGKIEMMIIKNDDKLYFFINGKMVGCCQDIVGMGANDVVAGALLTMNMNATFTEYEATTSTARINALTGMSIKLDGDLSDWNSGLTSVGVAGSDEFAGKGVTFWSKLTDEGLYLGAVANHSVYTNTSGNWWENTNFEFFINGGNQYWYSAMNGGTTSNGLAAVAKTTGGQDGSLYTTTVEAYIPIELIPSEWITDGVIRVGYAWKTPGDVCNNGNDGTSEYWLVPGHPANNLEAQFAVDSTGIYKFVLPAENLGSVSGNIEKSFTAGVDLTNDNGNAPYALTVSGDQQWAFFKDQIVGDFVVTTKVTAEQVFNEDAYPRFGLMLYTGSKTVYFNVEAGELEANKPAMIVTGGLGTGDWDWSGMYHLSGATGSYTGSDSVELTIARKGSVLYFYINGNLAGIKAGYVTENEQVALGVLTFNIGGKFFDYSLSTDASVIDAQIGAPITLDGDLSDWNSGLTSVGVAGSDEFAGKGVTFWSKLTDEGLYLGAVANHSVYTNTSGNWWENTNFEFFINGGNQYWYSAMNGGTTSNGLAAVAKTTGGQDGSLYTTTVEAYIPIELIPSEWITDGVIRVGYAWKTPGDVCNNGNDGTSEYWLVPGHPANDLNRQFIITKDGIEA